MTEVALAFSSIDKPRADAVARILNAVGYEVSAQPLTPEKIDRASAVLAFWSPSSINSQPVQTCASQAAYSKKLVSVRAGPADPPAAFALVTLHDLSSWTGSLDAPELRTLVSHVAKMAPPANQRQQNRNIGFAGNGFDPYGQGPAQTATSQRAPAPMARDVPQPRDPEPVARERAPRTERTSEEPRRSSGGGMGKIALGAVAVTVLGGAAVAAINYSGAVEGVQTADVDAAKSVQVSAPAPVAVEPSTLTAEAAAPVEAAPDAAAAETAPVQVAANTYAATPAAAPATHTDAGAVTVQNRNGWTATLPATPPTRTLTLTAQRVSAGAPAAQPATRPQQPTRLAPIGGARPQATDLVAVDGANLATDDDVKPAPGAQPAQSRVWQKEGVTYGPDN